MTLVSFLPRFAVMTAGLLFVGAQAKESVSSDDSIRFDSIVVVPAILSDRESIKILRCLLDRSGRLFATASTTCTLVAYLDSFVHHSTTVCAAST
jgi:hypothetical protein